MELLNRLFKGDKVIWIIFMLLCVISIVEGFSAMGPYRIIRHSLIVFGGFGLVIWLHNYHYRIASVLILFLPVFIALLIFTLSFGVTLNNATRWITIFGISIQPSELAKLATVVFVAFMLSRRTPENEKKFFKWIVGVTSIMCILIFLENYSTAFLLFLVVVLMLYIGQLQLKKLTLIIATLIFIAGTTVLTLNKLSEDTQKAIYETKIIGKGLKNAMNRINNFGEPLPEDSEKYKITDENRQITHAQIAIAKGGIFGKSPGYNDQREHLPLPYSDFIYAIIFEDLGLVGAVFVMLLYLWLLFRVGLIAGKCTRNYPRYLIFGCALMLVMQALINMAIVVGLFPVTGQPLPLISKGGTSIMITGIYFAIILSVSRFEIGLGEDEEITEEDVMSEKVSDAELFSQQNPIENY